MSIADIRTTYQKYELLESSIDPNPYKQFQQWFDQAMHSEVLEPTAMTLSTVNENGRPSSRIVLLKGVDKTGFTFFTNYSSRKGHELSQNPHAALLFFWPELERQVRIEGTTNKISAQESDDYYNSRPLGSRIGAWASPQSQAISHEELAHKVAELSQKLGDHPQRPDFWGGFELQPVYFEFWQGRPSRLHDRITYKLDNQANWSITRIAP